LLKQKEIYKHADFASNIFIPDIISKKVKILKMKSIIFTLVLATFIALSFSLPQGAGEPKKIVVTGPGPGPWSVNSEQVASWWSTGFTADG
jgi:hypothetical protein